MNVISWLEFELAYYDSAVKPLHHKDTPQKMCLVIIYLIYMYKKDLALNNLQWLICHENQPNQIIYI